ncbi:MAG: penicillin acylase family protein, partial [Actinomycetota bacterium]|nr:penicillin acylase family protein [Actinomycetota bacterium]
MTTTVTRDTWGIAHIDAPDTAAAFEAQGYLAAHDRIWQMEWDRLRALGRWSEVVGYQGAKEDAFFLRLGLAEAALADWEGLQPSTRAMTEAYAAGVNRWLQDPSQQLPAEFDHHPASPEPWQPWHCVAVYKVRHIFMGTLYRKLWRGFVLGQVGPELTGAMRGDPGLDSAMVAPSADEPTLDLLAQASAVLSDNAEVLDALTGAEGGSNSWAIHGERTASGLPLLAGDPHRGIEFPNVYHQAHLTCPEFDAIGLGFPGVPGFAHFGHNAEVAWCITHGMADDTDVFVERFEGGEPPDDWHAKRLSIRGEDDVEVWCGSTPRGPVVLGDPADGVALSMMWTGVSDCDTTFDALLPILLAGSCDEIEEACRPWVIPVNNMLSADRSGDISFHLRGRVVERPAASRWTPVAGSDEFDWASFQSVSHDDLHAWRNPDRGFLVTANNRTS